MRNLRVGLAAVLACVASAQAADRPRTCLVLSGGGARGAAHIGVLKVLEEYRVPIDCIVGTSMGALVGAAYASGTTLAEMEKVISQTSTDSLFKERPPRRELTVRRKQDDAANLIGPEIGLRDGGAFLQKGFVSGVQLETVLRQLNKAKGYRRFDELPIPFRAVATDLVTGKMVVFGDGELASVMRASMSVPGAVSPVEMGDMLLIDGGITNNLPVDVAREIGAQVVIAVNLGTPLLKRKDLGSVVGVAAQMLFILTEQNVQASIATLRQADVLIEPALGDYSFSDFDNMPSTLPIGEEAARKVAGFLHRMAVSPAEYASLRQRQLMIAATQDPRPIDEIRLENLARVNPAYVMSMLSTRVGKPVDPEVIDRDIRRLYGTGDFEHVGYRVVEEGGRRILAIDAAEKSWGPNYLRFGLMMSSDFHSEALFDVLASYRRTWVNSLGAEWKTDFRFGHTLALGTELYQPLDAAAHWFVVPRVELGRQPVDVYEGNHRLAQLNFRYARAILDAGAQFTRYGEARIGLTRGALEGSVSTGPADFPLPLGRIQLGGWRTRVNFDQLDSANFPRAGWEAAFETYASRAALGARESYTKWTAAGSAVRSFGDHTLMGALLAGGKSGPDPLPAYDKFASGGFLLQSGYRTGALVGDSLRFGRLLYYRKLVRQTLLEGVYAGFSLEAGKMGTPLVPGAPTGVIKSASVFVALDSLLGPLYLGYGRSTGGVGSLYLYLGRP